MNVIGMWKSLRGWVRLVIVVLGVLAIYGIADVTGLIGDAASVRARLVKKVDLPTQVNAPAQAAANFTPSAPPTNVPAQLDGPQMRIAGWAWSSQMGLWYAMGGNVPQRDSLMAKHGANVFWYRQDDVSQMQNDLVTCAQQMASSGNAECSNGATHVSIMGDGTPYFVTTVNRLLSKLGPEYTVEWIGSLGYSRGEDKCMGLPEWKANPQSMKGGLIAAVIGDGDWNICLKFMGDNGVPNNPDDTTWDSEAVNWVRVSSYIEASEKYIAGFCEDRPVVKNGARTGETKNVCVQGVATWTPGDVMVAEKKGGLVSLASTREYSTQMPNAIVGIKKFHTAHPELMENFFAAAFEGGDNIKFNSQALRHAAEVSSRVYREETPEYWVKYYAVQTERDKQGLMVELGGSYANNLADNLYLFGLLPGSANAAEIVYTRFGDLLVEQYPGDFPEYTPVGDVINTRFIEALKAKAGDTTTAPEVPQFSESTRIAEVVSQRSWQINFVTGNADFTPDARAKLDELLKDLVIAGSLAVEIHGHTDNVGNADLNEALSERRAFAVKQWLEQQAPDNFPQGRIRVRSFGETQPAASNDTEEGRAVNRRVDIIMGSTSR